MKRSLVFFILLSLIVSGCNHSEPPVELSTEIAATETPLPPPTATSPHEPTSVPEKNTHYQFEMELDYSRHSAQVTQTINYVNKSNFSLPELMLVVPPRAFLNTYEQTELNGDRLAGFTEDGIRTTIHLNQPLEPGQLTSINISYSLSIPQREGSFGWSQRQLNLNDWHPFIPPLSSEGSWISHDPLFDSANLVVGEYIVNEIADFDLTLRLVEFLPNLLVASGAKAEPLADGMQYSLKKARELSFSISNQFHHEQLDHNGLLIQAYVFQHQRDRAPAMLQIASQAMDLFSEIYGPLNLDQISLVSADFLHNMEMDGLVLISNRVIDFYDNTAENNLTILLPHELAHQWFYSRVGNDQAMEPWLDETLATYSELLFYERYHPELSEWWWDNRIYAHPHSGTVNNSIYDAGSYDNYRASVYLNGAIFMHDLRLTMSDQPFMAALKTYVAENAYQIASKADFLQVFQAANPNVDIPAVFTRYFKD